ncbi:MAG: thioredoxin fold domain-containing protein [Campylobacterales bacterium]|nr:thioredoxin fold domain-containing protein [Campylobacterales bacterium]
MNKLLFLLVLTLSPLLALQYHSYEDALKLQKQNAKIIMLDVVRTDCHYCSDMERDVLNQSEMSNYLQERFIPVKINLDTEKLPLGIKVHFTPTFFFIDAEQKIIKKIPGSWNAKDFKELTDTIK